MINYLNDNPSVTKFRLGEHIGYRNEWARIEAIAVQMDGSVKYKLEGRKELVNETELRDSLDEVG